MSNTRALHEDYSRSHAVKPGTNRAFGCIIAAAFAVIGLSPLWRGGDLRWWSLAVALIVLLVAIAMPRVLRPLNRGWLKIGQLLQRVTTPLIMGLMFFVVLTPLALLLRALGKDLVGSRFDRGRDSYWHVRRPPGPAPDSMPRQF